MLKHKTFLISQSLSGASINIYCISLQTLPVNKMNNEYAPEEKSKKKQ
jgi:hypothetical protein